MQELQQLINLYHTAFIVFLILAAVFLILSIVLFFRFDIRGIYDMKTGRGAKRTIQKMQELNDQTGKLREDPITTSHANLPSEQRIQYPATEKIDLPPEYRQTSAPSTEPETELLSDKVAETELLSNKQVEPPKPKPAPKPPVLKTRPDPKPSAPAPSVPEPAKATQVRAPEPAPVAVEQEVGQTALLSQETSKPKLKLPGRFDLGKEIIWTHTEEIL